MRIIHAGQVIDGVSSQPLTDQYIFIENGRIARVAPAGEALPPDAEVIDARVQTLMPGMIDCHVHVHSPGGSDREYNYALDPLTKSQGFLALQAFANVQKDLAMGFTTLRSLDSPHYVDVALRNAINAGLVPGPRLLVCGQGVSVTGGHMDKATWSDDVHVSGRTAVGDGPWGCRKAAREQLKRGADVIKINACGGVLNPAEPTHQEMTFEEMEAVCGEAHAAQKRVAAHTSGGSGITDAIRAGVNSIEHGQWLTDEQIAMMRDRTVYYIPTLITNSRGVALGKEELGSSDAEWAWLTQTEHDKWDSLARAHRAGVPVAVGTDAGFWVYHGENAGEIELLVRGGFSCMEAIQSATIVGAGCLGLERELGSIEPGKIADLVIVNGNPLVDVRILQKKANIAAVFQAGKLL